MKYIATEFEASLLQKIECFDVLNCLTNTQRKRIIQYYFQKSTLQEIAIQEKTTKQSVHESLKTAVRKIKEKILTL